MPRPRKIPLPAPIPVGMPSVALRLVQPVTRVLIRAVASDDRDVALEAAESLANERAAALQGAGARICSIAVQTVCVERFTRWQVVVTIVYEGGANALA